MDNQELDLFSKQELLKNEIIDKQLDEELFLNYCITLKDNGDDMTNWTFDELKQLINEFQSHFLTTRNETITDENQTEIHSSNFKDEYSYADFEESKQEVNFKIKIRQHNSLIF
jgi:hypothetical protein